MSDEDTDAGHLGTLATHVELPDGALPVSAFVLVSYIDTDGTESFTWAVAGSASVTDLVGCLTVTTHVLVSQGIDPDDDDL